MHVYCEIICAFLTKSCRLFFSNKNKTRLIYIFKIFLTILMKLWDFFLKLYKFSIVEFRKIMIMSMDLNLTIFDRLDTRENAYTLRNSDID